MIISVTPDLALDEGYTYAGGLGVFEGDKFYAAAKLNLPYKVLTLFYNQGYVDYEFDKEGNPLPKPQQQPEAFLKKLEGGDFYTIQLREKTSRSRRLSIEKVGLKQSSSNQ